jgi:hypothetical protein
LSQLIRGPLALGTQLALKGYPAVSSQQDPFPQAVDPYFDGGYNTNRYSSANGGTIDGLQIEHNFIGVRDSYHNRAVYADTLVRVLKKFLLSYYFNAATLSSCQLVTNTELAPQPQAAFSLYPNPTASRVTLKYSKELGLTHIILIDAGGHRILDRQLNDQEEAEISLADVQPGFYVVQLESSQKIISRKLIVLPH